MSPIKILNGREPRIELCAWYSKLPFLSCYLKKNKLSSIRTFPDRKDKNQSKERQRLHIGQDTPSISLLKATNS